jgi:hypothetical protein
LDPTSPKHDERRRLAGWDCQLLGKLRSECKQQPCFKCFVRLALVRVMTIMFKDSCRHLLSSEEGWWPHPTAPTGREATVSSAALPFVQNVKNTRSFMKALLWLPRTHTLPHRATCRFWLVQVTGFASQLSGPTNNQKGTRHSVEIN